MPERPLAAFWFRDLHAPGRRGTVRAFAEVMLKLSKEPVHSVLLLHVRQGDGPPRRPLGSAAPVATPPTGRHPCEHGHTGRGTAAPETAWPQPIACVEVLALSRGRPPHTGSRRRHGRLRQAVARRGSWTGHPRSCPHAYPLHRRDQSEGPSLPARYAARRSAVLRPPRTPAALRQISPSAYTPGLCPTQAKQTGLSCSGPDYAHVPPSVPRRTRQADPGTGPARHGLRRDMSGSAPPL